MSKLYIKFVLVVLLLWSTAAFAQVLERSELHPSADLMAGELELSRIIDVGPATRLEASVKVTAKGNGTLHIGNLQLRVVDEHDDGAVYQNGMAHIEFVDINEDGWKEIVIFGIVNYTDEKTSDVLGREPFLFIYRYDPKRKLFRKSYGHASFKLEMVSK